VGEPGRQGGGLTTPRVRAPGNPDARRRACCAAGRRHKQTRAMDPSASPSETALAAAARPGHPGIASSHGVACPAGVTSDGRSARIGSALPRSLGRFGEPARGFPASAAAAAKSINAAGPS